MRAWWVQAQELRYAMAKDGEVWEVMHSGDVFRERWVEDAVMNYIARKQTAAAMQAATAVVAAAPQAAALPTPLAPAVQLGAPGAAQPGAGGGGA